MIFSEKKTLTKQNKKKKQVLQWRLLGFWMALSSFLISGSSSLVSLSVVLQEDFFPGFSKIQEFITFIVY